MSQVRPSPHPPSPRAQRDAARRAGTASVTAERAPRASYLRRHWRGELPLTEQPFAASLLWLLQLLWLVVGALWWGVGVTRSAVAHGAAGGSSLVSLAAAATGLGAFAWVGLFWWKSARFVADDVWATVSGKAPAAAVSVEAGGARVLLQGDLEFGSMRALRALLDAQPAIRSVRLESRGGRVAEGIALGELIASRNLDTLVTGECSSACVTAFAGGRARLVAPTAKIGLHSAGGAGTTATAVAEANRRSDRFIAARGVDLRVLEKGSAIAHDDIWFPEPVVLLASNLATDYAPASTPR